MLNKRNFWVFSQNNKGLSIVEVLIAAGLTAIVSLGVATMMQNASIEQKKIVLFSTLKELKNRIEFLARDPVSWSQSVNIATGTYNASAAFNSMRAQTSVSIANPFATPEKMILFDAGGAVSMNLLGTETSGSGFNGFTESGASCNTFSLDTGNDSCPISYRLLIGYQCPNSAASCNTPLVRIVGRLVYNPSPSGTLDRFRNLVSQNATTDISNPATLGKYDAFVERTPTQGNRSFSLALVKTITNATPDCANQGAGTCSVGTYSLHQLTSLRNVGGSATIPNIVGSGFQITEPGAYSCNIAVPAFATGSFSARLAKFNGATTEIASASTFAGLWSQSTAVIETKFNVSNTGVTDVYTIEQRCDALPGGTPSANQCTLGVVPSSVYYGPIGFEYPVVTINCYKFDTM